MRAAYSSRLTSLRRDIPPLVSAERTSRAAVAAEQLCVALWEALHQQLREGRSEQAAALGERIAEVSRSVAELASLERPSASEQVRSSAEQETEVRRRVDLGERRAVVGESPEEAQCAEHEVADADMDRAREPATIDGGGGAQLIDEQQVGGPIAIRASRQSAQSGSWSAAVQRRLDRRREDGAPFAVLLIELLDLERLRLAQSSVDADQVREVEAVIVEQLRPADALVREADGRYWLVAPDTDAVDAKALAIRLGAAVRRSASHRGVPLELAVGIAVCPEHGTQEGALLSHAEVDLYAAQARGEVVSDPDGAEPASS